MDIFERRESEVRCYSRSFPTCFSKAVGAQITDEGGREYLDFLSGAGALNYGHNDPPMVEAVGKYLAEGGIVHGLDMFTGARRSFLEAFESLILAPRGMDYLLQFPGPTGSNAVEAALKLARLVKGRRNVVAFTNGYHGGTLGALAVTAGAFFRNEAFVLRSDVSFMPYDGFLGEGIDTIGVLEKALEDPGSGLDLPAAVIVETVQADGGVNVARPEWLRALERLCREHGVLLIVDDVQVGSGRTGGFFSFEEAGIRPDIVTLSKSLSGLGLPLSLVLLRPELDRWRPGEHSGTFRGNNLALVSAAAALQAYWRDDGLARAVAGKGRLMGEILEGMGGDFPGAVTAVRGRGMIWGLALRTPDLARETLRRAFEGGLLVELCGSRSEVVKVTPPGRRPRRGAPRGFGRASPGP
jgi:diaminobutyrate-2-oxoglutarate transaminase